MIPPLFPEVTGHVCTPRTASGTLGVRARLQIHGGREETVLKGLLEPKLEMREDPWETGFGWDQK